MSLYLFLLGYHFLLSAKWQRGYVFMGQPFTVFPSHVVCFTRRMESLEMALQIILPLEKECALLCGPHLPFRTVTVQDLHPVKVDGIYQNLQVSKFS